MKNKGHKNQTKETYGKIMKSSVRVECSSGEEIAQSLLWLSYGLNFRKTVVPNPASRADQKLPPFPSVHTYGSFSGGQSGWGVKLTTHFHLVLKLKNKWTQNPASSIRLHGVHRNSFTLHALSHLNNNKLIFSFLLRLGGISCPVNPQASVLRVLSSSSVVGTGETQTVFKKGP